jgi:hypothetical protein
MADIINNGEIGKEEFDNVRSIEAERCRKFLKRIFDGAERTKYESKLSNIFKIKLKSKDEFLFNQEDFFKHPNKENNGDFVSKFINELVFEVEDLAYNDSSRGIKDGYRVNDYYTKINRALRNLLDRFVKQLPIELQSGETQAIVRVKSVLDYVNVEARKEQEMPGAPYPEMLNKKK